MEPRSESVVRWPGRLVRGLLRLCLALCALAFLLPLLSSLWSPYAVHVRCPVRLSRLPRALQQGPDLRPERGDRYRVGGGPLSLVDASADPWGEPYRVLPSPRGAQGRGWRVYSSGPDRRDQGGAGDDLFVADPAAQALAGARWRLGQLALLCLGLALFAELASPPRRERLAPELARAGALALLPGGLCAVYFLGDPAWLRHLAAPLRARRVLPLPLSAAGLAAALCFLVALRYRSWREPRAPGQRWPGARQRRAMWAAAAFALAVAAAGFAWDLARERQHERACALALAQLGGHNAITSLAFRVKVGLEPAERLRRFVAHAPPGHHYDQLGPAPLEALAGLGEESLELLLGALPRDMSRPAPFLVDYLRRHDPAAIRLAARFDAAERPALLLTTFDEFEHELLARWGRRGTIERLLRMAEDPIFGAWAGYVRLLQRVTLLCNDRTQPSLSPERSSPSAYRAWRRDRLEAFRAWYRSQREALPPRWWLRLSLHGSPPAQPRSRQMEARVVDAQGEVLVLQASGYFGFSGRFSFARPLRSFEVFADGERLWSVSLEPLPGDVSVHAVLTWGEEARVRQWAIPR